jgi:hypothetical protein
VEGIFKIPTKRKAGKRENKPVGPATENNTNRYQLLEGETSENLGKEEKTKQKLLAPNTNDKGEDIPKHRKTYPSIESGPVEGGEVEMKETIDQEGVQEEEIGHEEIHVMDLEEVEVGMQALRTEHGKQEVNNMQIGKLHKMQWKLIKSKGKVAIQGNLKTTYGNLGIKINPLKPLNNTPGEEKKRGMKPHKKKIEETGVLLVDFVD